MPTQPVTEAKLAWLIWQALEKLNARLWDRYEKDFLSFALEEENQPRESTTFDIQPMDNPFPDDSIPPEI